MLQRPADAGLPLRVGARRRRFALAALALKRERRARRLAPDRRAPPRREPKRSFSSSSARFRRTLRRRSRAGSKSPAATRRVHQVRRADADAGASDRAGMRSQQPARRARDARRRRRVALGERHAPREDRIAARSAPPDGSAPRRASASARPCARAAVAAQPPRDRLGVRRARARSSRARSATSPSKVFSSLYETGVAIGLDLARVLAARERAACARATSPSSAAQPRGVAARQVADRARCPRPRSRASATGPTPQSRPTGSGSRNARTSSGDTSQQAVGLRDVARDLRDHLHRRDPDRDGEPGLGAHRAAQRFARDARRPEQALGAGEVEEGLVERDAARRAARSARRSRRRARHRARTCACRPRRKTPSGQSRRASKPGIAERTPKTRAS